MSRFAALYADRVLIRNPLEKYLDYFPIRQVDDRVRSLVFGDLLLLWKYMPLVEKGIVAFAQLEHHFCAECYRKYSSTAFFNYEDRLEEATKTLLSTIKKNIKAYAVSDGKKVYIEVSGPQEIIEHQMQIINFIYYVPKPIDRYLLRPGRHLLTFKEAWVTGIIDKIIDGYINDFALQDWYTNNFDYTYLTNRAIDLKLLNAVNREIDQRIGDLFIEGLAHALPAVAGIPISKLLKLRSAEREVFANYRNSLSDVMRNRSIRTLKEAKQLFLDSVKPALDQISLEISNSRSSAIKKLLADATIYSGLVTVGLFSGLLPPNVGAIVGALGGLGFGHSILKNASSIVMPPESIRRSPYFFLWKVAETARVSHNASA